MVGDGDDSLQDGGVILGVGVDGSLQARISLCSVHLVLDVHYFLKYAINISLCVFDTIEVDISLFYSMLNLCYDSSSQVCMP